MMQRMIRKTAQYIIQMLKYIETWVMIIATHIFVPYCESGDVYTQEEDEQKQSTMLNDSVISTNREGALPNKNATNGG